MSIRRLQPLRRPAFTLIELLVVIAIIGILISILLPSLTAARRQSRQLLCMTNLNAMGKAARLYAHDNQDTLVQGDDRLPGGSGETRSHWVASLLPGLGNSEYVNNLFRRLPGVSFTGALHEVCKKTRQMQCPDFPETRQSLDYVVNAFPIPISPNFGLIGSVPGPGPTPAPAGREPSLYFRYAKSGRADLSKTIYVTEAHKAMPLPPPDGVPFPADHIWVGIIGRVPQPCRSPSRAWPMSRRRPASA